MRRLIWDSSFKRAFKRHTRRNPALRKRILDTLATLLENPFTPSLPAPENKNHELDGLDECCNHELHELHELDELDQLGNEL